MGGFVKKLSLIVGGMLFALNLSEIARAQVLEYFFRPMAGGNAIKGDVTYGMREMKSPGGGKIESKDTSFNLAYQYGFNEMLALDVWLPLNGEREIQVGNNPAEKQSGMGDPVLGVVGSMDRFFYEAKIQIGSGSVKNKDYKNGSIVPILGAGYYWGDPSMAFGVKGGLEIPSDVENKDLSNAKSNTGTRLRISGFSEFETMPELRLIAALDIVSVSNYKVTSAEYKSFVFAGLDLRAIYKFSDLVQGLLRITYSGPYDLEEKSTSMKMKVESASSASLAVRFTF